MSETDAIPVAIPVAVPDVYTNPSDDDDIVFSLSKAQMRKFKSEINCMNWKNLTTLINELIIINCEIFGGAARDIIYRDHCANRFYKEFISTRNSDKACEEYDNPTCHPESFKGRTLLPKDLDIFIKGEGNFEKVKNAPGVVLSPNCNQSQVCVYFRLCSIHFFVQHEV